MSTLCRIIVALVAFGAFALPTIASAQEEPDPPVLRLSFFMCDLTGGKGDAIEEEIDRHYTAQLDELGDHDPELSEIVTEFRDDERAHRDAALAAGAERAPAYPLLSGAIRLGCRLAIRLSERI